VSLFLVVFFSLYGGLHLYAFLKARAALAFHAGTGTILALFMLLMVVAPIIIHFLEKAGYDILARIFSWTGYTWMGALFLFVSVSLIIDCYRLILSAGTFITGTDIAVLTLPKQHAFFISLVVSLSLAAYGYFEARDIRTERVLIKTPKIPAKIGMVKIVQISDVHLGLIVRQERLRRMLAEVKRADPDILVSTGDLVDGQINGLAGLAELLQEINPRYGKFAVTGNHEFYAGLDQALEFTAKAGFTMLRGEGFPIAGIINIAGVDDPAGKTFGLFRGTPEKELLSGFAHDRFTLLLKHRPLVDRDSEGLFDLQLSGHVHKGQIFPFSLVTWLYYPIHAGRLNLEDNALLYVSRGTGTWGPPIRFLSPPEVTVVELVHAD